MSTSPTPGRPPASSRADVVPAWSLAVVSMASVQFGSAISVRLFPVLGPAGTAWLRLTAGALILLALNRPRVRGLSRRDLATALALGVTTGTMTMAFLGALDRLPLGTTVAIEFLGPLGVAVLRAHDRRLLVWPAIALAGVLGLTEPWQGDVDPLGVALAAVAGAGWGTYIVLTQRVGDRFAGLQGLSFTIPVAALTAALVGLPQAVGGLTWPIVAAGFGLALLLPVIPFALELLALRRLTASAFGTLMAVEPALGVLVGALVLAQVPGPTQVVGVVLVVAAGIGAERSGRRGDGPQTPALQVT